jgi:hypothetical protein
VKPRVARASVYQSTSRRRGRRRGGEELVVAGRFEAAAVAEAAADDLELGRGEAAQHADLIAQDLGDVDHAVERAQGGEGEVGREMLHGVRGLEDGALEPELLGLMHHQEEELVRDHQLVRGSLQGEQLAGANVDLVVELAVPDLLVENLVVDRASAAQGGGFWGWDSSHRSDCFPFRFEASTVGKTTAGARGRGPPAASGGRARSR